MTQKRNQTRDTYRFLLCHGKFSLNCFRASETEWAHPLVRWRAFSQLWQHERSSFLHSMSYSSTNCKSSQRTLETKLSRAIGVDRVAHGKSRSRLRKRIGLMKPPGDCTGAQFGGRTIGWQSEHSTTKGQELLAWPKSQTESQGGGFAKESGGWNQPRRP